jgi:hypothetical protein
MDTGPERQRRGDFSFPLSGLQNRDDNETPLALPE